MATVMGTSATRRRSLPRPARLPASHGDKGRWGSPALLPAGHGDESRRRSSPRSVLLPAGDGDGRRRRSRPTYLGSSGLHRRPCSVRPSRMEPALEPKVGAATGRRWRRREAALVPNIPWGLRPPPAALLRAPELRSRGGDWEEVGGAPRERKGEGRGSGRRSSSSSPPAGGAGAGPAAPWGGEARVVAAGMEARGRRGEGQNG
jgi:hypothetical protein